MIIIIIIIIIIIVITIKNYNVCDKFKKVTE